MAYLRLRPKYHRCRCPPQAPRPCLPRLANLAPVIGATVSARFDVLAAVALADNGVTPDAIAGDGTYSGVLNVPNGVSSARLTVTASAPGKLSATSFFDFDVAAAPANDLFAARTVIGAGATRSTGSNVNSGFEVGEPRSPNVAGSHSVWWSWTAASTGVATITTAGSNFDTTLAVYAGTTLENLTMLAANDDSSGVQSSVSFNAVAGRQLCSAGQRLQQRNR